MTPYPLNDAPPSPSAWLVRTFGLYARRFVKKNFNGVRLSKASLPSTIDAGPLVVFLNHASWWDPLICVVLALKYFPHRTHYVPIDAEALEKYKFFKKMGFFAVERGTRRGAANFLKSALAVLDDKGSMLWLTPQGSFTDPRERPVRFQPGLGHAAHRLRRGIFLPLALEYPFWEEKRPEALCRFGRSILLEKGESRSPEEWTALFENSLTETQDRLAEEARRREPGNFEKLLQGRAGVDGVYDLWRSVKSRLRGKKFDPFHGSGL